MRLSRRFAAPAEEREQVRQTRAKPLLASLREWFETTLPTLSRKSDTTAAIRYALSLWHALQRYLEDGQIEIDNNLVYTASGIVQSIFSSAVRL